MLLWPEKVIKIQSNLEKSEVSNIPDTYQANGDIWFGNLNPEENRRNFYISV